MHLLSSLHPIFFSNYSWKNSVNFVCFEKSLTPRLKNVCISPALINASYSIFMSPKMNAFVLKWQPPNKQVISRMLSLVWSFWLLSKCSPFSQHLFCAFFLFSDFLFLCHHSKSNNTFSLILRSVIATLESWMSIQIMVDPNRKQQFGICQTFKITYAWSLKRGRKSLGW